MACLTPESNSNVCIMVDVCPSTNGAATLLYRAGEATCVYSDSSTVTYDFSFPMPDTGGGMTPEQYNGLVAAINGTTSAVNTSASSVATAVNNGTGATWQAGSATQTKIDELGGTGMAIALLLVFIAFVVLGYRLGKRKGDM